MPSRFSLDISKLVDPEMDELKNTEAPIVEEPDVGKIALQRVCAFKPEDGARDPLLLVCDETGRGTRDRKVPILQQVAELRLSVTNELTRYRVTVLSTSTSGRRCPK